MQGHHKYSDGFSDTSSSGSFMDDTDREVSNLTDRAFRSLCIGEEAIYNDSEFPSSPTERHNAFVKETQQKTVSQETFSYRIQDSGEAEGKSEMASTFQHSYTDVIHQEQAFMEGGFSYMNNGSKEVTWQQSRSASRVSSLIKAFSSGECYHDSGTCDVILARDRYRDFGSESWDRSALLNIQRELSEFSGHHQNFKSGPFQSYRNHFYTSDVAAAVAQMDTTVLMSSSKRKIKELNSTNCFFHSEFSPFQLWEEYNRFPFESTNVSGFMSASEFPRWYDSPMYKELKDNNRIPNSPCESRLFNQRQIQDVVPSQRSRSTVLQKASAIEKRCESEMASNYPPWKKNNNFVRNKLPGNRPSTVSPTNERTCRPDSNLFSNNKVAHELVVESTVPSSVTPFNITQLLTPVIHTRQETETSEILQFAHTPSVSDYSSQGETEPKLQTDVKHLRDSYKSKATSLLFNLKDNRKRVKSTYSPTRFKGQEITDRNKQTSRLEGRESRFSDILVSQETAQENSIGTDARASCNLIREPSAAPITPKDYTDGFGSYDNLTLASPQIQDGVANYKSFHNQKAVLEKKGENIKYKPLAIERQNDKHPADDKEMKKETFTPDRGADIKNDVQKNYQPSRISPKDVNTNKESEDVNTNKESAKQRHEMSPSELMSSHLTAAVKTENSTPHNPPAILHEKQTIQHDQKENLYGQKDLQVTSTENTKSNSSLNKNSLLGLDRNTEEPNVHHKSKITVEQSKNEPIKNSSGITASQLTSSSSDMKYKNGIPPSKRLMEPAKSELTSNLQTNTLSADAEKLLNRIYKHNSGHSSDSEASSTENMVRINSVPANNPASQRTREPKTLKPFNNEDGQALIIKNITTKENYLAKQQNNSSQVKAVETTSANQMVESQSKPGTNKQSLTQIASAKAKEICHTMSEDMDNCTASLTDLANIRLAFMPKNETYRDNYQRPASACYERPESACYDRPESACSDMRPLGKPPTVPPKSEKALRRAQRLATRRMKKAETPKMPPENQEQLESKSIRDVAEMPSSPSDMQHINTSRGTSLTSSFTV
ncbi:hypothetical protein PO909_019501 [Leuciscus waleckii]